MEEKDLEIYLRLSLKLQKIYRKEGRKDISDQILNTALLVSQTGVYK